MPRSALLPPRTTVAGNAPEDLFEVRNNATNNVKDVNDERGSDERGSDERGSDERGSDERGSDERGSDERGSRCSAPESP